MLLWPRLDRAKIRKVADDPMRMAEIIERRTSQPFDVILAMLTKHSVQLTTGADAVAPFDADRTETTRLSLRIIRSEGGSTIQVQDLLPA